jgi:uncharacterized protein YdeI (YjbR/CyaY-like superfamily)
VTSEEQSFSAPADFAAWIETRQGAEGAWIRMARKGHAGITYAQALDVALCWGWIDGQKRSGDDASWWQYFSPRKKGSVWSQINRGHVARLTEAGLMQPAGLAAVETAKASGEWERAYQGQSNREIPEELKQALDASPAARAFFETLNAQNRFAFVFRVSTPKKPETRWKKAAQFVEMMERGEVFYP